MTNRISQMSRAAAIVAANPGCSMLLVIDCGLPEAREDAAAAEKTKQITITMSGRRPIKIDPAIWGLIARADSHDGLTARQANHEWAIHVRELDGRRLVYGWVRAGGGEVRGSAGGFLIDCPVPIQQRDPQILESFEAETIRAIRRVAGVIGRPELADECIADLPAEEL